MQKHLIEHWAPTLVGLKTGSLFNRSFISREELVQKVKMVTKMLNPKRLYCEIMRLRQAVALIYIYRSHQLQIDLVRKECQSVLSKIGYQNMAIASCLVTLKVRLCS